MKKKIDIVYLWVDGEDEVWRRKRKVAYDEIQDPTFLEPYANVDGRFRDNGELMYSLRSLEAYFPDHGDIYIITDNQVPHFLKEDSGIKIISHTDIMAKNNLPTFSSKSIEAIIPFIPELSEVFLYFNDDVFLGPDFLIQDLYDEKPVYYFVQESKSPDVLISESILSKFYPDYTCSFQHSAHTPKTVIKQDFKLMAEQFDDLIKNTQKETFRMQENISFLADFFPRWMIHHGKGIVGTKQDRYYGIMEESEYSDLVNNFESTFSFCINDTGDDAKKDEIPFVRMKAVLETLFPKKSRFEK